MEKEYSRFFYLIKLCWRNRYFLAAFDLSVIILSVIISLTLPLWYKADSRILVQSSEQNTLSAASLLQGLPFSLGETEFENTIALNQAIVESRYFLDKIIDRFELQTIYDADFREDVYKALKENLNIIDNEDGTFTVFGFYEEDPQKAAELVNFAVDQLIDLNIEISQREASSRREYLENSYKKAKNRLYNLEDSLKNFQERSGIIQLEDQVRVLIEQLSELEAQKIQQELELDFLRKNMSKNYQRINMLKQEVASIQGKINKLKTSEQYSNLALKNIPEQGLHYLRLKREVTIGQKLIEILLPELERAKLEEHKNVTSLTVLDKAVPPERKDSPRRASIVIISTFLGFIFSLITIYIKDFYQKNKSTLREVLSNK